MRINAYLARAGISSRRGADELIKSGRVTINGQVATLDARVEQSDTVCLDGKTVKAQALRYLLLNKPVGYVTTLKDPEGRPTVIDLIDANERITPVGRLDFNTSGALLLTNDGQLAHSLMHPSRGVDKVYQIRVKGIVTDEILNLLSNGVELEDGRAAADKVEKVDDRTIELTLHQGRNRQVRRMVEAVGLSLKSLHRSKYGPLTLEGLATGQSRELSKAELQALQCYN